MGNKFENKSKNALHTGQFHLDKEGWNKVRTLKPAELDWWN